MKALLALAALAALWWWWQRPRRPDPSAAARLLGVPADATDEMIVAAHRAMISRVHPDKGGTPARAAEINAARDTLLRR